MCVCVVNSASSLLTARPSIILIKIHGRCKKYIETTRGDLFRRKKYTYFDLPINNAVPTYKIIVYPWYTNYYGTYLLTNNNKIMLFTQSVKLTKDAFKLVCIFILSQHCQPKSRK